eukprot:scaffold240856_cov27-Tisochrysis_lutea.AAC.3
MAHSERRAKYWGRDRGRVRTLASHSVRSGSMSARACAAARIPAIVTMASMSLSTGVVPGSATGTVSACAPGGNCGAGSGAASSAGTAAAGQPGTAVGASRRSRRTSSNVRTDSEMPDMSRDVMKPPQ